MTLEEFNALPPAQAESALLDCCGSTRWAKQIAAIRPFDTTTALYVSADAVWQQMDREDILEAFSHHPQIGQRATSGSGSHRRWSEGEQTGARGAAENVMAKMAERNRSYFDKFGYIYIVCASGKSAEEMLALLDQRLQNDPVRELPIATEQQRQITRLRLQKLLAGGQSP